MKYNEIEIQDSSPVVVSTGGKLYIAGEYSVLTNGQSAIIKNIDIFMYAEIRKAKEYSIYSDMFGYTAALEENVEDYGLIQDTVKLMNEYLSLKGISISPFSLKITGKMEKHGKKYGIGSSGSVTVLTVKAIAGLYMYSISKEEMFRLACLVLLKRGDNGSMGDIACISYSSLIAYRSFDREWLRKELESKELKEIMRIDWGYNIEELECPERMEFLVGWTGKPSISGKMINNVNKSIDVSFLKQSEEVVSKLKDDIISGNVDGVIEAIRKNRKILKELDGRIYTKEIRLLVGIAEELGICAKSSGAGGGDCGIAVISGKEEKGSVEELIRRWEENDIEIIYKGIL